MPMSAARRRRASRRRRRRSTQLDQMMPAADRKRGARSLASWRRQPGAKAAPAKPAAKPVETGEDRTRQSPRPRSRRGEAAASQRPKAAVSEPARKAASRPRRNGANSRRPRAETGGSSSAPSRSAARPRRCISKVVGQSRARRPAALLCCRGPVTRLQVGPVRKPGRGASRLQGARHAPASPSPRNSLAS